MISFEYTELTKEQYEHEMAKARWRFKRNLIFLIVVLFFSAWLARQ